MPVTLERDAPRRLVDVWSVIPWSADHHQRGTGRWAGRCDVGGCSTPAAVTVRVHRDRDLIRRHARCPQHAPEPGTRRPVSVDVDPQAARLYRAEECWFTLARDGHSATVPRPVEELQELVDTLTRTAWWARNAVEQAPIAVSFGRTGSSGARATPGRITVRGSYADRWVTVHELAHHAAGFDGQPHGPVFAARLLDLHALAHGVSVARLLRDAFDIEGVLYQPPTTW